MLAAARNMIHKEIIPCDANLLAEVEKGDRWQLTNKQIQILNQLKSAARNKGLWNLWLSDPARGGAGLNTVEYTYFAEEMGKSHLATKSSTAVHPIPAIWKCC